MDASLAGETRRACCLRPVEARAYRWEMRVWPLYDLRIRTPRLELRLPDLDLLDELIAVSLRGVHPPDTMPFGVPWTDRPSPQMEREALQHHLLQVAQWKPEKWTYNPVVIHQGTVIGTQDMRGENFRAGRSFSSGSWLGLEFQGRGFGKEMRAAILHLGFAGLGAKEAQSSAFKDNPASLGVSRALGYQANGRWRAARRGGSGTMIGLRLTSERWRRHQFCEVAVEGLDPCLEFFGAAPAD